MVIKAEADGVEAVRLYDAEVVVDRMLVEAEGRGELGLEARPGDAFEGEGHAIREELAKARRVAVEGEGWEGLRLGGGEEH